MGEVEKYFPSIQDSTIQYSKSQKVNTNFHSEFELRAGNVTFKGEVEDINHDFSLFKAFFNAINKAFVETHFRIKLKK